MKMGNDMLPESILDRLEFFANGFDQGIDR
jgi:hypothetical protein